jgi:hypothetical protein
MCASGQAVIVNGGKIAGFDAKLEAARAPGAHQFHSVWRSAHGQATMTEFGNVNMQRFGVDVERRADGTVVSAVSGATGADAAQHCRHIARSRRGYILTGTFCVSAMSRVPGAG